MNVQTATSADAGPRAVTAPIGLLAELTHRCPCSVPTAPTRWTWNAPATSYRPKSWLDVLAQAADLGILQLHLSGGEPTVRRDLEEIVAQAAKVGLYSNLITAGVLLTRDAPGKRWLTAASIMCKSRSRGTDAANADRMRAPSCASRRR